MTGPTSHIFHQGSIPLVALVADGPGDLVEKVEWARANDDACSAMVPRLGADDVSV